MHPALHREMHLPAETRVGDKNYVASDKITHLVEQIRDLDTAFPGEEGDAVAIVTAIVAETMTDWTGACDDPGLLGALTVLSLMASRIDTLHRSEDIGTAEYEIALDLCLEFSMAICRLLS